MANGILFLCVANSARSQMAEGLAGRLLRHRSVMSAGSEPKHVNPLAIEVMREEGIDIMTHRSKAVTDIQTEKVGIVITLCEEAVCPAYLGCAVRLHWPLLDPAAAIGDKKEMLMSFRKVRDKIKALIQHHFSEELTK